MIIGVTDEEVDVVDKWVASKKKTGYPIVIERGGLEQALGVPHFPYSGVIDPQGILSYAGDSPESALKAAMKAAKAGSMWPKKLAGPADSLRHGKLAEAWVALKALESAGGLGDEEQQKLDKFVAYVTSASAGVVKSAQGLYTQGLAGAALAQLEPIAAAATPLPSTEEAKKLVAEIKAMPTFEAEMKGGELYAAAFAKEEADDFLGAIQGYKDVGKKAAGSKVAEVALARAKDLVQRGMPGYESVCEKCRKAKKACEKHAKTVKL